MILRDETQYIVAYGVCFTNPDNEALGQVKSRKSQYLQGLSGFWKAPKIHLYIKLTSNGAKADAEVEKSHISYQFVYCSNLIRIKDLEERPFLRVFFCPNHSANVQVANYLVYRKFAIICTTI